MKSVNKIPTPLFDVKKFIPNGITQDMNGRLPADKLKQIHCGGKLYVDAARSWLAMVHAALADGIFLNLNFAIDAYRTVAAQIKRFKQRFEEIDTTAPPPRYFESSSRIQREDLATQRRSKIHGNSRSKLARLRLGGLDKKRRRSCG